MLKLTFNAQDSRLTIVVVQEGALKIYLTAVGAFKRRKDRMKLSLPPKLVEKLVWVPVILFCKIFVTSYVLMPSIC